MPRYDYECGVCHLVFELKQGFDAEPVTACPRCENSSRRLIHSVPVVFKGSGFYVNDYGKGKSGANGGSESKSSSESESGSKSESGFKSGSKSESDDKPKSAEKPKAKEKAEASSTKAAGDN
ncbi:MAG: FmdB family transcriptional regulator [Chloroflexi bacterium]|nr:FmdB family transcriptional regulator [Chloroflexota bacterium]